MEKSDKLIKYFISYKSKITSIKNKTTSDNKILNDVDCVLKLLINRYNLNEKNYEQFNYELFAVQDIYNLCSIDDDLYYLNCESSVFNSMTQICNMERNTFKFFLVKMCNKVFEDFSFIIFYNPITDMIYKNYDMEYFEICNLFFKTFKINNENEFIDLMDNNYVNNVINN